jgi:hypothetical protein
MHSFDGLSLLSCSWLLLGTDIHDAIQRCGYVWMELRTRHMACQSLTNTEQTEVKQVLVFLLLVVVVVVVVHFYY